MGWADTEYLGCALKNCSGDYVVSCRYDSGNTVGSLQYELGTPCSACPDRTTCVDGLCVPAW
ncbi:hypothetical protein OESDEN_17826 [Oesophagostomum dentatum]|uniref:SCP domain-containing protein n=1 Tax=Oesophagostomum dentatum TaxID=61180 RepID=A0A0B1SGY2_OESDE|nr:hypothetical protein OESDEN_17826 [Oesophagostomum dentatum]